MNRPSPASPDAVFLRIPEAAARYAVGEKALRQACREGRIPALRRGQAYLLRPDDVERWVVETSTVVVPRAS